MLLSLDVTIVAIGSFIVVISIALFMIGMGLINRFKKKKIHEITDTQKFSESQELAADPKDYIHPIEKKLEPLSPSNYT